MTNQKTPRTTPTTDSPVRHIKIPDNVWLPALKRAKTEGPEGIAGAAVVRALLRRYAAGEIKLTSGVVTEPR